MHAPKQFHSRSALLFAGVLAVMGGLTGCGSGAVTPPTQGKSTNVPTSNENVGVEVGFSPLGIFVRKRLDSQNPTFTLTPKSGQRTTPTVDLTGFGQTLDLIIQDQPFADAVYPADVSISGFGETFCIDLVEPEVTVEKPCDGEPDNLAKPISVSFAFNPAKVPAGFQAKDATIFVFDGEKWWDLGANVDAAKGVATVSTTTPNLMNLGFRRPDPVAQVALQDVRIEVSKPIVLEGDTAEMRAFALYSNNTMREVTETARFHISDLSRAVLVGDTGLKGLAEGQVTVNATFNGFTSQDRQVTILDISPPSQVTDFQASVLPSGSEVFLTWTGVPESDVTFYEILGSSQPFTDISAAGVSSLGQTSNAVARQFTMSDLTDGDLYLTIVAVDDSGNKDFTPGKVQKVTILDRTAPDPVLPTLTLNPDGPGVLVDWTAYNGPDAKKYDVRRSAQPFSNVNDATLVGDHVSGKTFLDTAALAPGTYFYAVVAFDAANNNHTEISPEELFSITIPSP